MVVFQPLPQLLLVPLFAQRRREDVLGAFKAGDVEVLNREVQVLRTGLGINRQAAITRFEDLLQRIVATKVHDVDGRARHFRKAQVISFENAGHWVHHDRLDAFLDLVREFL